MSLPFVSGDSLVTGGLPAQRASNGENVSIWWRYHVILFDNGYVIGIICTFELF